MRVGIPAQDQPNETFGVNVSYLTLIEEVGGTPVIIYPIDWERFLDTYAIDGLLLPGGADVSPRNYNHLPSPWTQKSSPFLEHFDFEILPGLISTDFPIFGICRGLQTLNVQFGGSLWQHLWNHPYSKSKDDLVHEVLLLDWEGNEWKQKVNSFHHQCIWKLGNNLEVIAKAPDNTIEAIIHETLPIAAVQWHPERIRDEFSLNLMKSLFS